jgi:hypothetical protein
MFGSATWSTGWGAGAGVAAAQNLDPRYLLPGQTSSAKLTAISGANNYFAQTINAGNVNKHSFSALVMKPDFSAVTVSDCQITYNGAQTTTYLNLGNGLYLLTAINITGINAGTSTGVTVANGKTVFLLAFQMEELAYATPIFWGDLLGCAWTGTAHASTSTRTGAVLKLPIAADTLNLTSGSIRVEWRTRMTQAYPVAIEFFDTRDGGHATSLAAYWNNADQKFTFSDGVNSITSAAQTFASGERMVLVFTWGPSGLNIFKNGANVATGATYTVPSAGTSVYLGVANNGAFQVNSDLVGLSIYDTELTLAQVAADYANMLPILTAGGRVETIPWLWVKDGDNIVDNCDDSSRDNWAIAGGVPGTLDAVTSWDILTAGLGLELILSNCALDNFLLPTSNLFYDISGTVVANTCGGQEFQVTTTNFLGPKTVPGTAISPQALLALSGKEMYAAARIYADNPFYLISGCRIASYYVLPEASTIVSQTLYGMSLTRPLVVPDVRSLASLGFTIATGYFYINVNNPTGSSATHTDYFAMLAKPTLRTGASYGPRYLIKGTQLTGMSSTYQLQSVDSIVGDAVELVPEHYNELLLFTLDSNKDPNITNTTTIAVSVAPRWALL